MTIPEARGQPLTLHFGDICPANTPWILARLTAIPEHITARDRKLRSKGPWGPRLTLTLFHPFNDIDTTDQFRKVINSINESMILPLIK